MNEASARSDSNQVIDVMPPARGRARTRRTRLERAEQMRVMAAGLDAGHSQRQMAAQLGVARSTLQDGGAGAALDQEVPAALQAFAQTSEGVRWLQRQVLAAQFVITLLAGAGVRVVCQYLELSGLSAFVGASYGTQQRLTVALETLVVAVAAEQRRALAEGMPRRQITVGEDETFHPDTCLVGMALVSNFILLEQYTCDRSAATWTEALAASLEGLAVEVIQGTSDEAKGLLSHVQTALGAHHSPDLFHVQHEVIKATSLNLAREVKQAEAAVTHADAAWQGARAAQAAFERQPRQPRGRPPAFEARTQAALAASVQAERHQQQVRERQTNARECVRELGALYHPYDLTSGQAQSVERVGERFRACWTRLAQIAEAADLPQRAGERLAKAQRVTTQLLATIAFFFATLQVKVEALNLPPALEAVLREQLIPAIYLDRVAERSTHAEQRHALRTLSAQLLEPLRQPQHPFQALPVTERQSLEQVALECADLFQRSSASVEGRNGQLSLHHHGHHRLTDRKLAALTALHNYFIRRPDGTTAAERFFGRPPAPLFEQLLERMPLPPSPARRRPRPLKAPYLLPIAA
jgi:hypothetical protein